MSEQRINHRSAIQALAPPILIDAVKAAAAREMTSTSEYVRRTLIARLRADGIDPAQFAAPQAGAAAA